MSIQSYDINLAAAGAQGSTQIIEASGQIIDFLTSGSAFDVIEVRPNMMQGASQLKQGQGFDAGSMIDRWLVVNKTSTAVAGTVVISTAGFRNFRISGDVNVLDGGKSRTLSGAAFSVNGIAGAATAGQYSRLQLWNPANSGKRLIVENMYAAPAVGADGVFVSFTQVQLATAQGAGLAKLAGGANSVAGLTYIDTTAAAFASPALANMQILASGGTQVKPVEPLVIPPGWGVLLWGNAQNTSFACQFEWYEEPST